MTENGLQRFLRQKTLTDFPSGLMIKNKKGRGKMKKIWKACLLTLILTLSFVGIIGRSEGAWKVQAAASGEPCVQLQYGGQKEFHLSANQIRQGDTGKVIVEGKTVTDVKWSSSKPSVLAVNGNGEVTARHTGTAVVTAKYTYKKKTYQYTLSVQVINRWEAEEKKFPTGSYWNDGEDNDKVTSTPCIHEEGGSGDAGCRSNYFFGKVAGIEITGYQCHGFALKVADDIYGSLQKWKYYGTYRDVQAGDVIRINGSHTIIVTKVLNESIQYADCNANGDCQIQWGQTMTKKALRASFTYMYSR